MRLKVFTILAITLLLFSVVSATTTEIYVKAPKFKEVQVAILSASGSGSELLQRYINYSDRYGDFKVNFTSEVKSFHVAVFLKEEGKSLMPSKKLVDQSAGENIYVEMIPEGFEKIETPNKTREIVEPENNTEENNLTEINSSQESLEENLDSKELVSETERQNILGLSILDNISLNARTFSYIGFAVLGLVVILFLTKRIVSHKKHKSKHDEENEEKEEKEEKPIPSGEIRIKKLSEFQREQKEAREGNKNRIDELESKIDKMQRELKEMKKAKFNENKKKESDSKENKKD